MTPIDIKTEFISKREQKMTEEVKEFVELNFPAAVLWKDENVCNQRNIELYNRVLRKLRLADNYEMCQRKGKVIIKQKGIRFVI